MAPTKRKTYFAKIDEERPEGLKGLLHNRNFIICASVILVAIVGLIILVVHESSVRNKLEISNETDLNVEYVKVSFYREDSDFDLDFYKEMKDVIVYDSKIKAGKSAKTSFETIDFSEFEGYPAYMKIAVKFEGKDEFSLEDGYFFESFDERIVLDLDQTNDGRVFCTLKTGVGYGVNKVSGQHDADGYFQYIINGGEVI